MSAFEQLHSDVVVKPIFGSEGKGIARIDDAAVALRTFKLLVQLGAVIYLQEFIEHEGVDLRLLVVGNHVLGMRRRNPADWRTNVSRGAVTEPLVPDEATASAARRAAQATGALLAGVDLLPSRDGRLFAIEVNAAPGWKALSETLRRDVAALVLDEIDRELRRGVSQRE
jgi:ribosomal protein S6--L-glutamate ligase